MALPIEVLVINLLIIAFFAVAVLYCSSAYLLRAMHVHKLTVEAHTLKNQYAKRLDMLRQGMVTEIEIISPGKDQEMVGVDIVDEDEEPTKEVKNAA